jgi:hypothetical protein
VQAYARAIDKLSAATHPPHRRLLSFPRKRESIGAAAFLDPRLRGGDKKQAHPLRDSQAANASATFILIAEGCPGSYNTLVLRQRWLNVLEDTV